MKSSVHLNSTMKVHLQNNLQRSAQQSEAVSSEGLCHASYETSIERQYSNNKQSLLRQNPWGLAYTRDTPIGQPRKSEWAASSKLACFCQVSM